MIALVRAGRHELDPLCKHRVSGLGPLDLAVAFRGRKSCIDPGEPRSCVVSASARRLLLFRNATLPEGPTEQLAGPCVGDVCWARGTHCCDTRRSPCLSRGGDGRPGSSRSTRAHGIGVVTTPDYCRGLSSSLPHSRASLLPSRGRAIRRIMMTIASTPRNVTRSKRPRPSDPIAEQLLPRFRPLVSFISETVVRRKSQRAPSGSTSVTRAFGSAAASASPGKPTPGPMSAIWCALRTCSSSSASSDFARRPSALPPLQAAAARTADDALDEHRERLSRGRAEAVTHCLGANLLRAFGGWETLIRHPFRS